MKKLSSVFIGFCLIATSGCGSSASYPSSSITNPASSNPGNQNQSGRNSSQIGVSNGHLVDASGFALYITGSSCTGSCLTVWPPDNASSTPTATGGANSGLVGLSSGQITYNGHLLYYFESDTASGQATGNNVGGFTLATP